MNPLQEITPKTIENMKDASYQKHVIDQGKVLETKITNMINWQAKLVKSFRFGEADIGTIYPENVKILKFNGFDVYKATILYKVKKSSFNDYYLTWGDTSIEDILQTTYSIKDYNVLDYKKL